MKFIKEAGALMKMKKKAFVLYFFLLTTMLLYSEQKSFCFWFNDPEVKFLWTLTKDINNAISRGCDPKEVNKILKNIKKIVKMKDPSKELEKIKIKLQNLKSVQKFNDASPEILINQVGYLPSSTKVALLKITKIEKLKDEIIYLKNPEGKVVLEKKAEEWSSSPKWFDKYFLFDFSQIKEPGDYYIECAGARSFTIHIDTKLYEESWFKTLDIACRMQMCGIEVTGYHKACHTDDGRQANIGETKNWGLAGPMGGLIPLLSQKPRFEKNEHIDCTGGWHDAGDFNKYPLSTCYILFRFLTIFEEFNIGRDKDQNGKSDILDQIVWGLSWLFKMQDNDGGVFQQVFNGHHYYGIPEDETDNIKGNSDDRPLDTDKWVEVADAFASVIAHASITLKKVDPSLSKKCLEKSIKAWEWSEKHRQDLQFSSFNTKMIGGNMPDEHLQCYKFIARAELFMATGDSVYLKNILLDKIDFFTTFWGGYPTIAAATIYTYLDSGKLKDSIKEKLNERLAYLAKSEEKSPYQTDFEKLPFVGENGYMLSKIIDYYYISKAFKDKKLLKHCIPYFEWVLGRNPANLSFVTGLGQKNPKQMCMVAQWKKKFGLIPGTILPGPMKKLFFFPVFLNGAYEFQDTGSPFTSEFITEIAPTFILANLIYNKYCQD